MADGILSKPVIDTKKCTVCGLCILQCPELCITQDENKKAIEIDYDYCKTCGICIAICPKGAMKME